MSGNTNHKFNWHKSHFMWRFWPEFKKYVFVATVLSDTVNVIYFFFLVTIFRITFQLNTRLQWLQEILKGAQVQSTCNTIAAPVEMLSRHRLYRSTAMTSTASLLTRMCCWAVDILASLRCTSACTNYQKHPQSDVGVRPPPILISCYKHMPLTYIWWGGDEDYWKLLF